MKFDFTNKICAVTGAGAGMGQAISVMLAKSGATVVMSDLAESFMAETCKLMDETGAEYHCVYGDLSKVENAQRVVTETIEKYGRIDVLVNVAGIVLPIRWTRSRKRISTRPLLSTSRLRCLPRRSLPAK